MEKESKCELPYLYVLVNRKDKGTFGHRVYRKPTHIDWYSHKDSNHLGEKTEYIQEELKNLQEIFKLTSIRLST